jgi:hypothetical protein
MGFKNYRDCDARFRLRKVVVELYGPDGDLLDRRRMFGGLFFAHRLKLKQRRMSKFGKILLAYTS